jgi:hypothetical protein
MVVGMGIRVQNSAHRLTLFVRSGDLTPLPPTSGSRRRNNSALPRLVRWYEGTLVRLGHMLGDHSLLGGANEPGTVVPILSACVCRVWQALHNPTKPSGSR